jgi:Sap, sulfolipid-1-addressing protein
MDLSPEAPLALTLAVLALLDGLSVGTLLIPVFLLLPPGRVRVRRILLYLGTITLFYLLVGLLFLWGLVNVVDVAADFLSSDAGRIARLVVGAALLAGAFLVPGAKKKEAVLVDSVATGEARGGPGPFPPVAPDAAEPAPGRIARWRDRLLDPATPPLVVVGLAIAAGLVEVATMLPYVIAMTMLADAGIGIPLRIAALAGYCLLMIAPALLLLLLRVIAARAVEGPLRRLGAWLSRTGAENTAWIVGIVGFLIARGAASELGLFSGVGALFGTGGS